MPPTALPLPSQRNIRWRILALLFAASFVGYMLRSNLSIVGERMMVDLHLSQIQLGWVLAAFAWGYALFQLPGGLWGDRIGARRALAIIAVLWGVITLLMGLVPGPNIASPVSIIGALIVLRFLMGVVQAPLYPVTNGGMTYRWFPVSGWAFPNGLCSAGLTLGSAATVPLIAWLMETVGWRQSFWLTAPLGFLLALFWWWYVRNTPAEHPQVCRDELDLINADRPIASENQEQGRWQDVLRNRQVLLLTASYFCSNYVFYIFFNWLFIYLIDNRGFKVLEGGYYAAAPWISGALFALLGGVVCDRLTQRVGIRIGCRLPAMCGLLLSGGLLLAAATTADPVIAVVLLSLCLGFQQFTESAFWAATISVSGKNASSACGVLNTGGNVVGGIGALMVPITVQAVGWQAALATGAVFAAIGALLWCWVKADQRPL